MHRILFLSCPSRSALFQASALLAALMATACVELPPTPKPDYAIHVKTQNGKTAAIPPQCASWNADITDPFDNQPLPQFGCANARNLALMIDRPEDLLEGRPVGAPDSVTSLGAVVRYRNNQTRGLIWTGSDANSVATTTASTPASSMTGEVAASSGSSSSKSKP
ncbi:MAG: CpaD family pilus assembly lipoprotein [Bdellovibrionales bacterium]